MVWHSDTLIPFIALRCNFTCKYCITRFAPDYDFSYTELPGKDWISFINAQDNVKDVIFNGGEPTLHSDFPNIINSLRPFRLIAIGTNYSSYSINSLLQITPRDDLIIDGTFHPHFISHADISHNLLRLKEAGFVVRVHVLDYPGFTSPLPDILHSFQLHSIDSFVQHYEGFYQGTFYYDQSKLPYCSLKDKTFCNCTRSIYTPIAPNGDIYFCHYLMYSKTFDGILGNIFDPPKPFPPFLDCRHLGYCNPCDWPRSYTLSSQEASLDAVL